MELFRYFFFSEVNSVILLLTIITRVGKTKCTTTLLPPLPIPKDDWTKSDCLYDQCPSLLVHRT